MWDLVGLAETQFPDTYSYKFKLSLSYDSCILPVNIAHISEFYSTSSHMNCTFLVVYAGQLMYKYSLKGKQAQAQTETKEGFGFDSAIKTVLG